MERRGGSQLQNATHHTHTCTCDTSGIVFYVNSNTGSVNVVTPYGIIGSDRSVRQIGLDKYSTLDDNATISEDLSNLRSTIKSGLFTDSQHDLITLPKAHLKMCGHTGGRRKCSCKGNCSTDTCGCRKHGVLCSSACKNCSPAKHACTNNGV